MIVFLVWLWIANVAVLLGAGLVHSASGIERSSEPAVAERGSKDERSKNPQRSQANANRPRQRGLCRNVPAPDSLCGSFSLGWVGADHGSMRRLT